MKTAQLTVDYVDSKTNHAFHIPIRALKKPSNAKEYKQLEHILDSLVEEVRDDEHHPLAILMEIMGDNLEQYDDMHEAVIGHEVTDIQMVEHLMTSQGLLQKDLAPIFGSQANVSKFLHGERQLSKAQILGLKEYFGISADFFLR